MKLTIQLKCKFRAFGVTFGSVAYQAEATLTATGVTFDEVPVTPTPINANVLVNRKGVYLAYW